MQALMYFIDMTNRNENIVDQFRLNISPAQIARNENISRERVRQILKKHGLIANDHRLNRIATRRAKLAQWLADNPDTPLTVYVDVSGENYHLLFTDTHALGIKRDKSAIFKRVQTHRRIHPEITKEILEHDKHLSQTKIAEKYGCSQPLVSKWLREFGISK